MTPNLVGYKKFPFTRLLFSLITGILIEWYLQIYLKTILFVFIFACALLLFYTFLSLSQRFILRWLHGLAILILVMTFGATIMYVKDIRHQPDWYNNNYTSTSPVLVTIEEPLVVKTNSYKALATVNAVYNNGRWQQTNGKILVYLKKEEIHPQIDYGTQIVIQKPLQEITNSGNPGGFDYKRYCLFHDITAQVFLKENEYAVLPTKNINWLDKTLFTLRDVTINALQQNIPDEKEQGVAEALLIGYREDLDKDLVQAYSNTGVVHIIAISGLHLGMIYAAMVWIFSFFKQNRTSRIFKAIIILFVLWTFTLIAGAVPSIMRSAVMFTFIVIGDLLSKRSNMYNALAASAFCMLVYDPFTLWDVGFLLSYAAVISIITFQKPIYNWLYYQNKLLDKVWGLASVTLSAQILTIPIVIFYFHQFPNFFLITNFIAVPLSGFILCGEVILLALSFITSLANLIGTLVDYMIYWLNSFIENINTLPIAVWNNLQLSVFQTWMLFGIFICVCIWLMLKSSKAFITSIAFACMFFISLSFNYTERNQQEKLIVYNVPKQCAIDVIQGNHYSFTGDSILLQDGFLRNFHLKPARVLYRTEPATTNALKENQVTNMDGKKILLLTQSMPRQKYQTKIPVDILIIAHNPRIYINQLQQAFDCKLIVFDSSNPLWKIQLWKKDCDSLHLRFHSTPDDGAFVMDL
ncbi:ComEC/Rec2 family competence protein [Panacibacter ginsenosidivorans]|uniref:ComEC/Rec2 family competence protein n=1 Tax=Panacibacter ginsenosidivorans TaxID=1813871 RepID=A0A5B8V6H8_9BACT|nr:ComEC/Rec2 family competence protein [Panacibacter ginsenosidivorans]QEC67070.1 ComEC/Rec2 family competence protein [Panacibacter ginsenosidivorans]